MDIKSLSAFILDMDGVLYRGGERLDGAREFLTFLRDRQYKFILLTNNATRTPEQVAERLQQLGMPVPSERILTSSVATAQYLQKANPSGARLFVIGEEGLRRPLADLGFTLSDDGPADYVVLGMDRMVTYDKLKRATLLIRAGAKFVATNPDLTFPTREGLVPGAGALAAALTAATGVTPVVIGKPEPAALQMALERMDADPHTTAALGDRLDTDIEGGYRAGLPTILVLTGVATRQDMANYHVQPTWVFTNLRALIDALSQGH